MIVYDSNFIKNKTSMLSIFLGLIDHFQAFVITLLINARFTCHFSRRPLDRYANLAYRQNQHKRGKVHMRPDFPNFPIVLIIDKWEEVRCVDYCFPGVSFIVNSEKVHCVDYSMRVIQNFTKIYPPSQLFHRVLYQIGKSTVSDESF